VKSSLVETTGALGTTNYLYDGANLLEEVDQSGNVLARYTQGQKIDEPLAQFRSGTAAYYQVDGLGSVTSIRDNSGTSVAAYSYDAFGNVAASTGFITNPFRYTGREFDPETGIYYYRARYYNLSLGGFISEDPQRFESGVNFYTYVLNAPTVYKDPFGWDIWLEGPAGSEPTGHLSINVGDPNGSYASYSFGVDGNGLEGMVYQDVSHGGDFYPGYYLHTTAAEDAIAKAHLDSLLGSKDGYRPWRTCRTFSIKQFDHFKAEGLGTLGPPPPRAKDPRNSSFNVPWFSSLTASDPRGSSSSNSWTPASSNRK